MSFVTKEICQINEQSKRDVITVTSKTIVEGRAWTCSMDLLERKEPIVRVIEISAIPLTPCPIFDRPSVCVSWAYFYCGETVEKIVIISVPVYRKSFPILYATIAHLSKV